MPSYWECSPFILEFIPVLGTLVSGAICVLFALTHGWLLAVIVLAYFVIVHIIEGDVVGPRVVGKVIGLHPVVSLVALIAGGELFGIWGVLFASPVAGVIQAFLIAIWYEWHETHRQEFQAAKDKVTEQVEKNIADKPLIQNQKRSCSRNVQMATCIVLSPCVPASVPPAYGERL